MISWQVCGWLCEGLGKVLYCDMTVDGLYRDIL